MTLKQKDFIEIEFTARVKDTGEIFDSNITEDLRKSGMIKDNLKGKKFIYPLGQDMFLKGVDDFLIGKDLGKYKIELSPEKAFGFRDSKLVQLVPMKIFKQNNLNPIPGATFNFDGRIAKVLSASGGRVMVDFNNPIAGKTVVYDLNVLKKLEDLNEKINSFINFLFRQDLKFEVKEKTIIIEAPKKFVQIIELFEEKFKELFDLGLKVKEVEEKVKEASESVSN
jgi:FKBP-type peptidyl-prolyl cis-trans isomerase 2